MRPRRFETWPSSSCSVHGARQGRANQAMAAAASGGCRGGSHGEETPGILWPLCQSMVALGFSKWEKSIWRMILVISLGCCLASPGRKAPIDPHADLQLGFPHSVLLQNQTLASLDVPDGAAGGGAPLPPTHVPEATLMIPPFPQHPGGHGCY